MACGFMKLLPIDLILTYMKRAALLKGQLAMQQQSMAHGQK